LKDRRPEPPLQDPQLPPPSRPVPRRGREDGMTNAEFPQLGSSGGITTNGLGLKVHPPPAPSGDGGRRSWASIASSTQTNGPPTTTFNGPVIDSSASSSRLQAHGHEPSESSPSFALTNNEVPMGVRDGYVDLTFDPACLSNESDPIALSLGEFLAKYQLNHHSLSLIPRGLVNQSNFCYINATLQVRISIHSFIFVLN